MIQPAKVLRVLITHEKSGVMREAWRRIGHDAWSCDLEPAQDGSFYHLQMDALEAIRQSYWNFIGMHPVCTFLTGAGIHWNNRGRGWLGTERAVAEVSLLMRETQDVPGYLENPVGIISSRIRKPDQIIQPYEFGDDASKKTCLWLRHLPVLTIDQSQVFPPRLVDGKKRWSNQTDSGQNKLAPSPDRAAKRAQSYPGIAKSMAAQWAEYLLSK